MNYFVGEIGRPILLATNLDWSSAVTKTIIVTRPDSSTFSLEEVVVDDPVNGHIHFLTRDGDLTLPGLYIAQAKLTTETSVLYSPLISFVVDAPLVEEE